MSGLRNKILLFTGGYLPGHKGGGPIRSVANLVETLGDELSFKIFTLDRDLGSRGSYPGIRANDWQRVGKADVFYISPKNVTLSFLRRLINDTEHDILYLNSFFSLGFTIKPLILRRLGFIGPKKTIVAPRGEFSPGALKIRSLKKKTFIFLAKVLGLYQHVLWQASSKFEMNDIKALFQEARIVIAPVTLVPASLPPKRGLTSQAELINAKRPGSLKMIFLSRISPKKNLDGALTMLRSVRSDVTFDIYGPIEDDAYWKKCLALINVLPKNISVAYQGSITHDQVGMILTQYALFFFPTHGENFGHVISEALIAGCPILLSDQTPWRNLEKAGAGWDLPLEKPERFTAVLQQCVDMGNEEWQAMSRRAMEYGLAKSMNAEVVQQNRALFTSVSHQP